MNVALFLLKAWTFWITGYTEYTKVWRPQRSNTTDTPVNAMLIVCDEPELQLFPEQRTFWDLTDHKIDIGLEQEGVSSLVALQCWSLVEDSFRYITRRTRQCVFGEIWWSRRAVCFCHLRVTVFPRIFTCTSVTTQAITWKMETPWVKIDNL